MSHLRALQALESSLILRWFPFSLKILRMTSAYCVSGLNVQLVKKCIYLPRVGSTSKDWKHLSWVLVAVVTRGTMRMGERGLQGACWKTTSKPFQRYVTVARKLAPNAPPTHYLYIWYHRALEFTSSTNTYFPSPHPGTSENSHRYWQNSFDNESYWNHSWMVNITEQWDRDINEGENTAWKYSLKLRLNLKS